MLSAVDAIKWSFRQFRHRQVLLSIIVPCLIHSLLLAGCLWFVAASLGSFLFALELPQLPAYLQWADAFLTVALDVLLWILLLGVVLGLLAFGLSTITAIAHFIASPFNGWLAEVSESRLRHVNHPPISIWSSITAGFGREVQRLKYWFVRALGIGVLSLIGFWIPVLNSALGVIWLIFAAWMVGLQAIDYVADNNGFSFQQTLVLAKNARWSVILLGGLIMGIMIIPVLNLVSMALSVLAGTFLWVNAIEASGPVASLQQDK